MLFLDEFKNIASACAEQNILVVALKGISFFGRIYDPSERSLTDIDILISPADLPKLTELLQSKGYSERHEAKWSANNFKTIFTRHHLSLEIVLEVHTRLSAERPYEAWNLVPYRNFYILSPQDELIYLAFHYAGQHTLLKTKWLHDIHLLSTDNPALWDEDAYRRATSMGMSSSLFFCAKALDVAYGQKVFVPRSLRQFATRLLVNAAFLEDPSRHFFRYMIIKHLVKESLAQALSYDVQWLHFAVKQRFRRKFQN